MPGSNHFGGGSTLRLVSGGGTGYNPRAAQYDWHVLRYHVFLRDMEAFVRHLNYRQEEGYSDAQP